VFSRYQAYIPTGELYCSLNGGDVLFAAHAGPNVIAQLRAHEHLGVLLNRLSVRALAQIFRLIVYRGSSNVNL